VARRRRGKAEMSKPNEEVVIFLANTRDVKGRDLDVAIAYAGLMAAELRGCADEWEATVARLRELRRRPCKDCNRTDTN
jgi:hypothetical protein